MLFKMQENKILTLGGLTLEQALESIKNIAERHELQLRLLEAAARVDKIRRENQKCGDRKAL